jgi:hypothetical protein
MEKLQLKIGGMACSFWTETLKTGVGRMDEPDPGTEIPDRGSRIRGCHEG